MLTEPVPDLHERIGWEDGEAIADARTYLNYFRPTNDHRVLMGSASGDVPRAPRPRCGKYFPAARRRADRSAAGKARSTCRATGCPSSAPCPGHACTTALGYTGNGVGPSWLVGRMLASLALGERRRVAARAGGAPALPPEPFRTLGARVVRRALLAVDDAEEAGRRPPARAKGLARLPELIGIRVASR